MHACKKEGIMAEKLEKYKQILKREDEEFKEVMKAEVSTSLPSKLSRQKERIPCQNTCSSPISYWIFSIFF